jgi:hypothetical protein
MNIYETEVPITILARTCGSKEKKQKVTCSFVDAYHSLRLDKKCTILAEPVAGRRLSKYATDKSDKKNYRYLDNRIEYDPGSYALD